MSESVARPSLTPANPDRAAQARDAAIILFAEKGYRGTTINDIADLLGIRGPSLYKHVSSKQEILRDIIVSTMDLLLEHQREAIERHDVPADQLREMVRVGVLDHVDDRPRAFVCIRELGNLEQPAHDVVLGQRDTYWRRARAIVDAGVAAGQFSVASSSVVTFCLIELVSSPAAWFSEDSGVSHAELADQIATAALRVAGYADA